MVQDWSHVRRILSAYKNTSRKQDRILVASVTSKHGIVIRYVFVLLSGVVNRNEFTSGLSLLFIVVLQLNV